jgi:hypothetical protein
MNASRIIRLLLLFAGLATNYMDGNLFAEPRDRKMDWDQVQQLPQNTIVKVLLEKGGAIQGKWISADDVSATLMIKKLSARSGEMM